MHLLVIPSWYRKVNNPLAGIFFAQHALDMLSLGHEVRVLYGRHTSLKKLKYYRRPETALNHGLNEIIYNTYDFSWLSNKLHFFMLKHFALSAFKKYVNRFGKPDVILAHSVHNAGFVSDCIKEKHSVPFVLYEHSSLVAKGAIGSIYERSYESADKVLAVSHFLKNSITKHTNVASNNVEVCPLGLSPVFRKYGTRTKKSNKINIVSVGSLRGIKQYDKAIKSIEILRKHYEIKYTIVGEGAERKSLENEISQRNLEDSVFLIGSKSPDEIKKIMLDSDILLSTSKIETLGISILEGMSCGLVVVCTDSGGPRDTVNSSNGLFTKSDRPNDIAEAVSNVIINSAEFNRIKIQHDCINQYGLKTTEKALSILSSIRPAKN